MDRAKGRAVAGLLDDLMVEILSRVPVKDVRRSKCVSKPWRDLIADPLHRKKLPQTLEGFFHGGAGEYQSYGQFTSLSGRAGSAPPVDPSFSFLTAKLPGVEGTVLLDSCNGLLLLGCTRENKFGYIVCNPATEELVTVPASSGSCPPPLLPLREQSYSSRFHLEYVDADDSERYAHTYLMFDPVVSSRFHLVQFWENRSTMEVEVVHSYSSETRAWSDRSSEWERGEWGLLGEGIIKFTCGSAFVNGLLHLFVDQRAGKDSMIVAVDGEGKLCRIIRWAEKRVPMLTFLAFIGQSQGPMLTFPDFIGQSQGRLHCMSRDMQFIDYSMELQGFVFISRNCQFGFLRTMIHKNGF